MAHIYVYSPSGAVRDKTAFRRGVKRLTALGHQVEIDEAALSRHQRFAGEDETRLASIGRAAASGADVALITRGGYGLTRLLPDLPYKAIAKSIDKGTEWVGLSDFTAFQLAVLAKTGRHTWAGPALGEDFGVDGEADEIMLACFDDLIQGHGEGAGWRLPLADRRWLATRSVAQQVVQAKGAVLWGGNLCVLTSLLGTPFVPAITGGVLFLEDVHEHPYRIERMLMQLLLAGVLEQQQAICLGQFNRFTLGPHDKGFNMGEVVKLMRANCKVPVLTGLPFGHVETKVMLPVGQKVDLLVEDGDALLYWG
jgi:muramoyltetrapeptide carboxypeptidase